MSSSVNSMSRHPLINSLVSGIVVALIMPLILHSCEQVKPSLKVKCSIWRTTPWKDRIVAGLLLRPTDSKVNGIDVKVWNDGRVAISDLEVALKSSGPIFSSWTLTCDPWQIEKSVSKEEGASETIYRLKKIDANSSLVARILTTHGVTKRDIRVGVRGSDTSWTPQFEEINVDATEIQTSLLNSDWLSVPLANAADQIDPVASRDAPGSGVYVGGYDPVKLMNSTFYILQAHGIVDAREAAIIKTTTEASRGGTLIGGVDILKFNEAVINTMISKGIISRDEAVGIISRSQNAGGVSINGYNPIHLNAEILGALAQRGKIQRSEAQKALDDSGFPSASNQSKQ